MSITEAFRILHDHQKWRTSRPPYNHDPDNDVMFPPRPTTTPAQLTEAIDTILALYPNP